VKAENWDQLQLSCHPFFTGEMNSLEAYVLRATSVTFQVVANMNNLAWCDHQSTRCHIEYFTVRLADANFLREYHQVKEFGYMKRSQQFA
jgi:hypothetical protein